MPTPYLIPAYSTNGSRVDLVSLRQRLKLYIPNWNRGELSTGPGCSESVALSLHANSMNFFHSLYQRISTRYLWVNNAYHYSSRIWIHMDGFFADSRLRLWVSTLRVTHPDAVKINQDPPGSSRIQPELPG